MLVWIVGRCGEEMKMDLKKAIQLVEVEVLTDETEKIVQIAWAQVKSYALTAKEIESLWDH